MIPVEMGVGICIFVRDFIHAFSIFNVFPTSQCAAFLFSELLLLSSVFEESTKLSKLRKTNAKRYHSPARRMD